MPDSIKKLPELPAIKLPVWLNRGQALALVKFLTSWWQQVYEWCAEPLTQLDPDTCSLGVLNLIAKGRNVVRFADESEYLFRLRVKYAYANAVDAGSVAGIKRIFVRLGIGYLEVDERVEGKDWDVIVLRLTDTQLANNADLLKVLLNKYGRTCRRYEFETITQVTLGLGVAEVGATWDVDICI